MWLDLFEIGPVPFMSTNIPVPAHTIISSFLIPKSKRVSFNFFEVLNSLNPPSGI
jgi:hypothetical protein